MACADFCNCGDFIVWYIEAEKPQNYLFNGQPLANGAGGDFDNRYSQRGVQWAIKQVAKAAGVKKEVPDI